MALDLGKSLEALGAVFTSSPTAFVFLIFGSMLGLYAMFPALRTGERSGPILKIILLAGGIPLILVGFWQVMDNESLQELIDTSDPGNSIVIAGLTLGVGLIGAYALILFILPLTIGVLIGIAVGGRRVPGG